MAAEHTSHGSGHVSPLSMYITIFLSLMVLTAVTVGAAYVDFGSFNFAIAMVIATFKASLVVWYFMHVKDQSHLTKLTLATGLFFLAILLGMMLIDYTSKDFTPMPRPTDDTGTMGQTIAPAAPAAPAAH
jgi:cytochrome c oxidase subunit 4